MQKYIKYVNGKESFITSKYFWDLEKELTQKIIQALDKKDVDGRELRIEVAGPRQGGGGGDRRRR